MNVDMSQLENIATVLIAFGGFISPVVFYILQLVKSYIPKQVPLQIISVILGAVVGGGLVALSPYLGITGINYVVGIIGGLVGGFSATKQYDSAVKKKVAAVETLTTPTETK